jgi:hypothetical protein
MKISFFELSILVYSDNKIISSFIGGGVTFASDISQHSRKFSSPTGLPIIKVLRFSI